MVYSETEWEHTKQVLSTRHCRLWKICQPQRMTHVRVKSRVPSKLLKVVRLGRMLRKLVYKQKTAQGGVKETKWCVMANNGSRDQGKNSGCFQREGQESPQKETGGLFLDQDSWINSEIAFYWSFSFEEILSCKQVKGTHLYSRSMVHVHTNLSMSQSVHQRSRASCWLPIRRVVQGNWFYHIT